MPPNEELRTAGHALKHWFIATAQDAVAVAVLWLIGLIVIGVPLAPWWALLGGLLQFIPGIGAVIALIPPAFALLFIDADWMKFAYLLIVYAVIVLVDGFFLQPYFMKRTARVPIWASILAPIALGILLPFWGVLLAPPALAVIYAFKRRNESQLHAGQSSDQPIARSPDPL